MQKTIKIIILLIFLFVIGVFYISLTRDTNYNTSDLINKNSPDFNYVVDSTVRDFVKFDQTRCTKLDLQGCTSLTIEALACLANNAMNLPNLQCMDVSGCRIQGVCCFLKYFYTESYDCVCCDVIH